MLLLAADTSRDKFAWIDAIHKGARLSRCPVERVAPLLSLRMYGGCVDTTLDEVLQASPDTTPPLRRPDHHGGRRRKHSSSTHGGSHGGGSNGNSEHRERGAHDERHRKHRHAEQKPEALQKQQTGFWNLEKWFDGSAFKDI